MEQNEHITRLAAKALGIAIEPHWEWTAALGVTGFTDKRSGIVQQWVRFAPMSDPATAYRMEIQLRMRVTYKRAHDGLMIIMVGCDDHGGAVMRTIAKHEDPVGARMRAATQFAALCATMNDHEHETRADLERAHYDAT